jgi:hypothetical protein
MKTLKTALLIAAATAAVPAAFVLLATLLAAAPVATLAGLGVLTAAVGYIGYEVRNGK